MKTFEITKEQIKQLYHNTFHENEQLVIADLKNWFPDAFKTELEVGKWYLVNRCFKEEKCALVLFQGVSKSTYGFNHSGRWTNDYGGFNTFQNHSYDFTKATPQEVKAALVAEAKKRYANGAIIISLFSEIVGVLGNTFEYFEESNRLWNNGNKIFNNGIWAKTVETITKAEAEKLLNKRIL